MGSHSRTGQGCVWTGAGACRLWATHRCRGQERRRIAGLGKERWGDLSLGALARGEECTPVRAAFLHCWGDSGSSLSCPGKQPDGTPPWERALGRPAETS